MPVPNQNVRDDADTNPREIRDLSSLPLPAISWDANLCVTGWNSAAERLFGWKERDATAKDLCSLLYALPVRETARERLGKVLEGNGTHHHEDELFCQRGVAIICELS